MAQIYVIVRYAMLIVSIIGLANGIVEMVNEINSNKIDYTYMVPLAISVAVIFLGIYGSYKHNRNYLIVFALIVAICIVTGFFAQKIHYVSQSTSIVAALLAVAQAELMKRGYY